MLHAQIGHATGLEGVLIPYKLNRQELLRRSLSHSSLRRKQPDPGPAADSTDSDEEPHRRKRKKTGKYNPPLSDARLEILRLHIDEARPPLPSLGYSSTAASPSLPAPSTPSSANRRTTCRSADCRGERGAAFMGRGPAAHCAGAGGKQQAALRPTATGMRQAHPDSTRCPSHDTIHRWLASERFTGKRLVPVPKVRNEPVIEPQAEHCGRAIDWTVTHSSSSMKRRSTVACTKPVDAVGVAPWPPLRSSTLAGGASRFMRPSHPYLD